MKVPKNHVYYLRFYLHHTGTTSDFYLPCVTFLLSLSLHVTVCFFLVSQGRHTSSCECFPVCVSVFSCAYLNSSSPQPPSPERGCSRWRPTGDWRGCCRGFVLGSSGSPGCGWRWASAGPGAPSAEEEEEEEGGARERENAWRLKICREVWCHTSRVDNFLNMQNLTKHVPDTFTTPVPSACPPSQLY